MKIIKASALPTFVELKTFLLANVLTIDTKWVKFETIKNLVLEEYPKMTETNLLTCLQDMIITDNNVLDDNSPFPPVESVNVTENSSFALSSLIDGKKQILKNKMMTELGNEWMELNDFLKILSLIPSVAALGTTALLKDAFLELVSEGLILIKND